MSFCSSVLPSKTRSEMTLLGSRSAICLISELCQVLFERTIPHNKICKAATKKAINNDKKQGKREQKMRQKGEREVGDLREITGICEGVRCTNFYEPWNKKPRVNIKITFLEPRNPSLTRSCSAPSECRQNRKQGKMEEWNARVEWLPRKPQGRKSEERGVNTSIS